MRGLAEILSASMVRFGVLSGLSFTMNLGLTTTLHETCRLPAEAAFAIAIVAVFFMNFLFMRYYVFPGGRRSATGQLALYGLSSLGFRGGEYLGFLALYTWLGLYYILAIVAVTGASLVTKFFYYRSVVFSGRKCA